MPTTTSRRAGAAMLAMALLLLVVPPTRAADTALAIPDGRLRVTQRGAATVLHLARRGRSAHAVLPVEEDILPRSLEATRVIGAIPGRVLILASDYASRPAGGARMCGAGTETVLRVVALRPAPRETFRERIASCWHTIEEGETRWDAAAGTLTVERTTFSPEAEHLLTRDRVGPDGAVVRGEVERLP